MFQEFNENFINILSATHFAEGLAAMKLKGKWGYIDKNGNQTIPFQFDEADAFKDNLARVKQNDKYGFIDKSGNNVIPCIYENIGTFDMQVNMKMINNNLDKIKGLADVQFNGKWGYINKKGIQYWED